MLPLLSNDMSWQPPAQASLTSTKIRHAGHPREPLLHVHGYVMSAARESLCYLSKIGQTSHLREPF